MTRSELDVSRYLRLSRVALDAPRAEALRAELERILARFATMRRREDSANRTASETSADPSRTLESARDDVVVASPARDAIVENAVTDAGGALRVPRVIE